jgi:hypothetical protein
MRFTTIWDPRFPMDLSERLRRTRDWAAGEIAARLPLRIRYWVTLQMIGKATMKSPNVPASSVDYILEHMPKPKSRV